MVKKQTVRYINTLDNAINSLSKNLNKGLDTLTQLKRARKQAVRNIKKSERR